MNLIHTPVWLAWVYSRLLIVPADFHEWTSDDDDDDVMSSQILCSRVTKLPY